MQSSVMFVLVILKYFKFLGRCGMAALETTLLASIERLMRSLGRYLTASSVNPGPLIVRFLRDCGRFPRPFGVTSLVVRSLSVSRQVGICLSPSSLIELWLLMTRCVRDRGRDLSVSFSMDLHLERSKDLRAGGSDLILELELKESPEGHSTCFRLRGSELRQALESFALELRSKSVRYLGSATTILS